MARQRNPRTRSLRRSGADPVPILLGAGLLVAFLIIAIGVGTDGESRSTPLRAKAKPSSTGAAQAPAVLDPAVEAVVRDYLAARDYRAAEAVLAKVPGDQPTGNLYRELHEHRSRDVEAYLAQALAIERSDPERFERKLRVAWFFDPEDHRVRRLAAKHRIRLGVR